MGDVFVRLHGLPTVDVMLRFLVPGRDTHFLNMNQSYRGSYLSFFLTRGPEGDGE